MDGFICVWAQRLDPRTRAAAGGVFPVLHHHEPQLTRLGPKTLFSFDIATDTLLFNLAETPGNLWTASLGDGSGR